MNTYPKVFIKLAIASMVMAGFSFSLFAQSAAGQAACSALDQADGLIVLKDSLGSDNFDEEIFQWLDEAVAAFAAGGMWEEAVEVRCREFRFSQIVGAYGRQQRYAIDALALLNEHLGEDHVLAGKVYWQRGEAYSMMDEPHSANTFFEKSAELYARRGDWTGNCWSIIALVINQIYEQKADSAWMAMNKVDALVSKQLIVEEDMGPIKNYLLSLYGDLANLDSDYWKVIEKTHEALSNEIRRPKRSAADTVYEASCNNTLGIFYLNISDFSRAFDYFIHAGEIDQSLQDDPTYNFNLGQLFLRRRKKETARERFETCLRLLREQGLEDAQINLRRSALIGVSVSYKLTKAYDKAIGYSKQAVALKSGSEEYLALSSLATDLMGLEQPEKAVGQLKIAETAYREDPLAESKSLNFLANLYNYTGEAYFLMKEYENALKYFQKALIENHETFTDSLELTANPALKGVYNPVYFITSLSGKAKALALLEGTAKPGKSLETYELAMQWMDSLRTSYSSESSQLDWSGTFKAIYENAINTAYQSYLQSNNEEHLGLAFAFSEKSKNVILLEELKMSEGRAIGGIPPKRLQREKDLQLDLANLAKALRFAKESKSKDDQKRYEASVAGLRLELAALRDSLEREFPRYREIKYAKESTSITQVRDEILDDQTAFLSYFIGKEKAYLFLVTNRESQMIDLGDPEDVRRTAKAFILKLNKGSTGGNNAKTQFEDYLKAGNSLYGLILKEALSSLSEDVNRLLIVPDGLLNAVPFSAITNGTEVDPSIDFAELPYLLYRFDVQYAFSATLQIESWRKGNALPKVKQGLIMAPQYSSGGGNTRGIASVAPLIGADKVWEVIDSYMKVDLKSGPDATRDTFIDIAKKYGLLHLSTHGGVNVEDRGSSHLVFAPSGKDASAGKDYLLYHEDIVNLDLSAQLVVLSACETGLGKYEDGEGVYSLGRSFTYAGVPSVVMSLWKVNDFTTSELMPLFYHQIASGEAKDAALRQAKLTFLESADVNLRHPYYWSAFVSTGDSRPLRAKPIPWWYWVLGGLTALVLAGLADKRLQRSQRSKALGTRIE